MADGILVARQGSAAPYARTVPEGVLVAVTDHAAERYRQRVGTRTGSVDVKPEIAARVSSAFAKGRYRVERGALHVIDEKLPGVVYVCRHDRDSRELLVITLWEEGEDARVPSRYTNVLKRDDHLVRDRRDG
jgi:hypothetical protein